MLRNNILSLTKDYNEYFTDLHIRSRCFQNLREDPEFSNHLKLFGETLREIEGSCIAENNQDKFIEILGQSLIKFSIVDRNEFIIQNQLPFIKSAFEIEPAMGNYLLGKVKTTIDKIKIDPEELLPVNKICSTNQINLFKSLDVPIPVDWSCLISNSIAEISISELHTLLNISELMPYLAGFCFAHKMVLILGLGSGFHFSINLFIKQDFHRFLIESLRVFYQQTSLYTRLLSLNTLEYLIANFDSRILSSRAMIVFCGGSLALYTSLPFILGGSVKYYQLTNLQLKTLPMQKEIENNLYHASFFIKKCVIAITNGGGVHVIVDGPKKYFIKSLKEFIITFNK